MANYKLNEQMVAGMSEGDKETILSLYLHRCLTPSLIVKHLYRNDGIPEEIANHRLDAMILDHLIEPVPYGSSEEALFLTQFGVRTVVSLFGDRLKKLYKPGSQNTALPTCFDLKMHPANINHQMHLNQFGLEFEDYARGDAAYTYYDEKFMPPASDFIMPDGMIVLPERILFLEMDMGTERVKRLAQKWNSYRMFLNSPKAFYEKKPITMFFLLAGVKRLSYRQKSVMRSLMTYLNGRVNGEFEAYIETPEMCHEILQTRYLSAGTEMAGAEKSVLDCLRAKYGFTVTQPPFLKTLGFPGAYYIKRLNTQGKIDVIGSRPQEFILDLWLDRRFSLFQNITNIERNEKVMRERVGREVPYLLVVSSPIWAKRIPSITKTAISETIFFTTPDRMSTKSDWCRALFQIDQLKNMNHFKDDSLLETVHELRMAKL